MKKSLLGLGFVSCLGGACGGGGQGQQDSFLLLSVNVANGSSIAINQVLEFQFNQPVDLSSAILGDTISITGSSSDESISVPPVSGIFYLKPESSGRVLCFQPSCPTDFSNSNGGLIPGNGLESVKYELFMAGANSGQTSPMRSAEGKPLHRAVSLTFSTYPVGNPFLDPVPGPPSLSNVDSLPGQIGLNYFSDPISPIEIELDQPVKAAFLSLDWFFLRYPDPNQNGSWITVPSALSLLENCNAQGGAKLLLIPKGILPPGVVLQLMQGPVLGLGLHDSLAQNQLVKEIAVVPAMTMQSDAWIESFADTEFEDAEELLAFPRASWGEGKLQAATPFAGVNSQQDIEIGWGTLNGFDKTLDTNFSTLVASDGSLVSVVEGKILCRNFILKSDPSVGGTKHGRLMALGPNPLRIIASGEVLLESGTLIQAEGVDSPGVSTSLSGNVSEPGAFGRCGGGDGGEASPVLIGSSPSGSPGNGPFNLPGFGGKGGHSAYGTNASATSEPTCGGSTAVLPVKAAGGGGGRFAENEVDGPNQGPFLYGRHPGLFTVNCTSGSMTVGSNNPPCDGARPTTNTIAEPGTPGPTGIGEDNFTMSGQQQATIYDAVDFSPGAKAGEAGQGIFVDGDSNNDFWGTKLLGDASLQAGELTTLLGGSGGGAGGDAISDASFPPSANYNTANDRKGAGGGGGAGVVHIQSIGRILVDGEISADGGSGGGGEIQACIYQCGGGSGGGAGGMIVLESLTGITIGTSLSQAPKLHCVGGDRGYGSSLKFGVEKCSQKLTCIGGLNGTTQCIGGCLGGPCWNSACVYGNTFGGVPGLPARGKRNSSKSLGGAGGKGVMIFAVPIDSSGNLKSGSLVLLGNDLSLPELDCSLTGMNACYDAEIGVLRVEENTADALEFAVSVRLDPDPHIVLPSFGAVSQALTSWRYLGSAEADFDYAGTDAEGKIQAVFEGAPILNGAEAWAVESSHQVLITSQAWPEASLANPKSLIGDVLKDEGSGAKYRIRNAETVPGVQGVIRVFTDPADGAILVSSNWSILRRYFELETEGNLGWLPQNHSIQIQFQSADETGYGTGEFNSDSIFPSANQFSFDLASMQGAKFIRYRVTFSLWDSGVPDGSLVLSPRPQLNLLKLPFSF